MLLMISSAAVIGFHLVTLPGDKQPFIDVDSIAQLPIIEKPFGTLNPRPPKNLITLFDKNTLMNRLLLVGSLNDIWLSLDKTCDVDDFYVLYLPYLITLRGPTFDEREMKITGNSGTPIFAMVTKIGLPAVPALLQQLDNPIGNKRTMERHLQLSTEAIVKIYDSGGEGKFMAAERIKRFAKTAKNSRQVLKCLEYPCFKNELIMP